MTKLRIRRLLVAGGAGFLGSAFVRDRLRADPEVEIIVLDALRRPGAGHGLDDLTREPRLRLINGDVCDREAVEPLAAQADAIVNFASEEFVGGGLADGPAFAHTDVAGTATLLEATRKFRLHRFMLVSSADVYGPVKSGPHREEDPAAPITLAASARAAAEMLARAYYVSRAIPVIITRGVAAYGPRQPLDQPVARMITSALQGRPLAGNGDDEMPGRDYLSSNDQVSALARVLWKGEPGSVYNIGSGHAVATTDVAETILRLAGKPSELKRGVKDARWSYAAETRRLRPLGWQPGYGLTEGLRATIEWYRQNESWWRAAKAA